MGFCAFIDITEVALFQYKKNFCTFIDMYQLAPYPILIMATFDSGVLESNFF